MKNIAIAIVVAALAGGTAQAQRLEGYGGVSVQPKKRTKKDKEIDRHLFTAEYFLLRERDLNSAAAEYRKVLALDKANVHAGLALADIEIMRKKPKSAVSVLEKLSRTAKNDGSVWRALAVARRAAGDDKGMKAACAAALKINSRDGEAHWILFERALARFKGGDAAARAELAASATGYLSSGYLAQGEHARLAERTLIELKGDDVALSVYDAKIAYEDAFNEQGFASINQKVADARRGFEKCIAAQPERQECHYYLGRIYGSVKASEQYNLKKAKEELKRAPDLAEAHVELARLLRVDDDLDAAAGELGKAIKLAPGMAEAHVELGIVRKLDGNEDAAVKSFEMAYDADRYSAAADRALAELAKIRPKHPLVTGAMMFGDIKGDVFSTDRFRAAVKMVEDSLGGVDESAPEKPVLEAIAARLRKGSDIDSRFTFRVAVLKSSMVNAFALPDGSLYFTRGLFDFLKRKWPNRKLDASNDVLGHIMGHEMAHVIRRHTVQTLIYNEAIRDASRSLDPAILTHVTRLHEIEADREGIVLAFLAGYHPRGGIEFMEASGKEMEIPSHLDHPTYEERVHYLEEYWTNDVKYAFVSFRLGIDSLNRAGKLEASGQGGARAAYEEAADHFKRYRNTVKANKQVLNNLGIAYAKVGLMAMADADSPLHRWQTRFSVEHDQAIDYKGLGRDEDKESTTRGGGSKAKKAAIPWQLREARSVFEEALRLDPGYLKARLNLAMLELAVGRATDADGQLARVKVASGEADLLRGIVSAEQKQWPAAIASFQKAQRVKGLGRAARYNLARAYMMAGKKDQARAEFQAYVKDDRQGPWNKAAQKALKTLTL
jgi:predicted Zn-dependent protease